MNFFICRARDGATVSNEVMKVKVSVHLLHNLNNP